MGYDYFSTYIDSVITFKGDMPQFGKNCFCDRYGVIFYPAGNKTYNEQSIAAAQKLSYHGFTWREEGYVPSGKAGKDITWKTYSVKEGKYTVKVLEFTGKGLMKDYSLTDLPDWYPERISVDRILIDSRITSIGNYAFFDMENVNFFNNKDESFVFPKKLEKIGDYAFYWTSVSRVTLPETCSYIGEHAMPSCSRATSAAFPKGVKRIGAYAFNNSELPLDVKWDKIEFIGEGAFLSANNMTFSMDFPDSLETIESLAFADVKSISGKVELNSIKSWGCNSFAGTSVTELVMGENLSEITKTGSYNPSLGDSFKTITFKGNWFSSLFNFFGFLSRNKNRITLNYPAGHDWNDYYVSLYKDKIDFVIYGNHNITFVYPDKSRQKILLPVGQKIPEPEVTGLKEGEEFIGWYDGSQPIKGNEWDFDKVPMKDLILFALTNQVECDVTYMVPEDIGKMYNGKYEFSVHKVKYGELAPNIKVSKKGGKFLGWFEDRECTKLYDFQTPVKYNITLYSGWTLGKGEDIPIDTENRPISKATVSGVKDCAFTGKPNKMAGLKVKYKGKLLTEGEHYKVLYENNTNAGTARISITGIEDGGFNGTKTVTFKITRHKISKKDVEITGLSAGKVYTGGEITADSLKIGSGLETYRAVLVGIEKASYKEKYPTGGGDYDYTYEYKKNVNAGTATLVIRGVNNCKGTIKKTFKIRKAELNEEAVAQGRIRIELPESVTYIKGKNKPQPVVYYKPEGSSKEILLVKGKDYTLAYSNNTKVNDGSGKKVPKVKIKGIKNFKGTITRTFTIRL